jgi:universal stress protein E
VLVAVDAGPWRPKGADALSARLLEVGLWFAEQQRGDLHVLHVWEAYMERYLRRGGLTEAEVQQFVIQAREQARLGLEHTIAPFREHLVPARVHLERGDPKKAIAAFAARHNVDLLVIGTVARSGLAARVIGNTAEAVLSKLPCSMLVVRPDRVPGRTGRGPRRAPGRSRARGETL